MLVTMMNHETISYCCHSLFCLQLSLAHIFPEVNGISRSFLLSPTRCKPRGAVSMGNRAFLFKESHGVPLHESWGLCKAGIAVAMTAT